jgi:Fe-S-cluster containining protein
MALPAHTPSLMDHVEPGLPEHVVAHLPAADKAAQRNVKQVESRFGKELQEVLQQVAQLSRPQTPKANRTMRLRFLAGQWSRLVSQESACRRGCSHCCHVSVAVPRSEAELIAKATRTALNRDVVPYEEGLPPDPLSHFGEPCTFLVEGKCSIYEHRPVACRALVNMDDVELLCELVPGAQVPVPYANALRIQGSRFVHAQHEDWADIREWFPGPAAG